MPNASLDALLHTVSSCTRDYPINWFVVVVLSCTSAGLRGRKAIDPNEITDVLFQKNCIVFISVRV